MTKHRKLFIATWVLLISILVVLLNPSFANQDKINVEIDYIMQDFGDYDPIVINSRTMVPMRHIFETLGCKVEWDNATQSITSTVGDKVIKMRIGANQMTVNGHSVQLDAAPIIHKSKTMVPLRAVSEALGAEVVWVQKTRTARIFYSMPRAIGPKESMADQNKQFERLMTFNPRRMAFNLDKNHFYIGTIVGNELILEGYYKYGEFSKVNYGLRYLDPKKGLVYFNDSQGYEMNTWLDIDPKTGAIPKHRIPLNEKNRQLYVAIYTENKETHPTKPRGIYSYLSQRAIIDWDNQAGEYVFRKPLKLEKLQQFYQKVILGKLQNPAQHLDKSKITPSTQALSDRITKGAKTDYEKLRLIDKWLRDNVYYDRDNLLRPDETYSYAMPDEVIEYKRATCWGHSITFTDLARAQNIPATKVIGYISQDVDDGVFNSPGLHSWNVAFVEGRWILIDSTWNNASTTENGEWFFAQGNSLYFDASPVYMAYSHDYRYILESHNWEEDWQSHYEEY